MPHQNDLNTLQNAARLLVDRVFRYKQWTPASRVPLKVHFGEHGNHTFIPASYYDGIIDWLEAQHAETAFIESNVLYGGHRTTRKAHTELAHRHGFTRVPVWIADGEAGEDMADIDINGRYFKTCHVGRLIAEQEQIVVCSHFKGHLMAGFGGALKQLGMGCAARRGKLDQHMGVKPFINPLQCKQCGACLKKCAEDAIHIGRWSRIDRNKCVGCLGCMAVCPSNAVMINWLRSLDKGFSERIAEYALAAQQGKRNVYVTFAFNITRQCDCVGQRMKPIVPDLGILASADPVALDRASLDLLDKRAGRRVFGRGRHILAYAESLGVGEREYELEEIKIN
ncbi:DUF362 domain-containing protein [bacterium]|nr:DUF362 domain-containing protein [bacterium]